MYADVWKSLRRLKARWLKNSRGSLLNHGAGAAVLPVGIVDCYNLELRDSAGFIGDRTNRQAFLQKLANCRQPICNGGEDPLGAYCAPF